MKVQIQAFHGPTKVLEIEPSQTGLSLKHIIQDVLGFPAHLQRLSYCNKIIPDSTILQNMAIPSYANIQMSMSVVGGTTVINKENTVTEENGTDQDDFEDEQCKFDSNMGISISNHRKGFKI